MPAFLAHPCPPCCNCPLEDFSDDFSTSKTEWEFFRSAGSGLFFIADGRLKKESDDETVNNGSVCRGCPELDGVRIAVASKLWKPASNSVAGIHFSTLANLLGEVGVVTLSVGGGNYLGRIGSTSYDLGTAHTQGDTLRFEITQDGTGGGAGGFTYKVEWFINGVSKHSVSNVALDFDDGTDDDGDNWCGVTLIGEIFEDVTVEWDDFSYSVTYP